MYVCTTRNCPEKFAGICDEPLFCSVCLMDLTPLCAVTWPGHETDLGAAVLAIEAAVLRDFEQFTGRARPPEALLRDVLDYERRRGVPASRAYFAGDCIVVEVERPAGFG